MLLKRHLDDLEVGGRLHGPTHLVEFTGEINVEILDQAFHLLCKQYPVLRARVRYDGHGYMLYVEPDHSPRLVVLEGGEDQLTKETDRFLDTTHGVAELVLIHGGEHGYVALKKAHAVGDASVWVEIFDTLWRLYTGIANGSDVDVVPGHTLPTSCQMLLNERWGPIELGPPSAAELAPNGTAGTQEDLIHKEQRRLVLSVTETAQLIEAARALRTSVHALVCGAIVVGVRSHQQEQGPVPMACGSAINLRNRVSPAVAPTETTNFITSHTAELVVDDYADPVDVGREVKRQIDSAIADRQLWTPEVDGRRAEWHISQGHTVVDVTNPGVVRRLSQPAGLKIVDYQWIGQPESRRTAQKIGSVAHTYDGRFSLRSNYPPRYAKDEIDDIHERISANLCDTISLVDA